MKMNKKVIYTIILAILSLLIFNTIYAYAEKDTFTLYNKNVEVQLSYPVITYNDEEYIAIDDLKSINLNTTIYEDFISVYRLYGMENGCDLSLNDNIIYGEKHNYENASIVIGGERYILLIALTKEFSDTHTTNYVSKSINIWINDYTSDTVYGTLTIPENIDVPLSGFEVTVYYGTRRNIAWGSGESYGPTYLGYKGLNTKTVPNITDLTGLKSEHRPDINIVNSTTLSIPYGKSSAQYNLDIVVRRKLTDINGKSIALHASGGSSAGGSSGGGGSSSVNYSNLIGYIIDNEKYIGGDNSTISISPDYISNKTVDFTLNCTEKNYITGTITVPEHSTDLSYTVYAEGNRRIEGNNITREFVGATSGTIQVDQLTSDYKITVLPEKTYYVYVVFSNGEYIRKSVEVDKFIFSSTVNFDSFEKSNIVTGIIKLPEGISEYKTYHGDAIENISGNITLQSVEEPHYYLDIENFDIDVSTGYADFTLVDDIGAKNAVMYFTLDDNIVDLYGGGNYKDNTKSVPNVKYASTISTSAKNIVLNIETGKTISVTGQYMQNALDGEVYAIVQPDKTSHLGIWDAELLVYGDRISNTQNDIGREIKYQFTLPSCYNNYILEIVRYYDDELIQYISDNFDFVDNINEAKVLSGTDSISFACKQYENPVPFDVILENITHDNGYKLDYYINNPWDFDYENNISVYVAFYNLQGKLNKISGDTYSLYAHSKGLITIDIDDVDYELASKIDLIVWEKGTIRPLSTKYNIK